MAHRHSIERCRDGSRAEEAHFVVAERLDIVGAEFVWNMGTSGRRFDGAGASVGRGRCGG